MNKYAQLGVFIAIVAAVSFLSGIFMPGPWYEALAKPTWTPPNWLFGPVWSVLYVLIAVAGWIVWREPAAQSARWLWIAQLGLNGAWSPIMFGAEQIGIALIVSCLMWLSIVAFIGATWQPVRRAALLFLPYLAWVTFATVLNFAIWRLNAG